MVGAERLPYEEVSFLTLGGRLATGGVVLTEELGVSEVGRGVVEVEVEVGAGGGGVTNGDVAGTMRSRIHAELANGFERGDFARRGMRGCGGTMDDSGRTCVRHSGSMSVASRAWLQRAGGGGGGWYTGCEISRCSFWKFS